MPETNVTPESPWAHLWRLDPAVAYLNHGSFGACPRAVLEAQAELRARSSSASPWTSSSASSRPRSTPRARRSAAFVGADPDDLAFVPNATAGVNAVLRSLALRARRRAAHDRPRVQRVPERARLRRPPGRGARVVVASVPFPLRPRGGRRRGPRAVTPRTRLALLDHVTSPTALVFPIERLVARARRARRRHARRRRARARDDPARPRRASAPRTTPANAHKWLCAPKGAAFLHVRTRPAEGTPSASRSATATPEGDGALPGTSSTGRGLPTRRPRSASRTASRISAACCRAAGRS